jgi:DNA-binding transcriptional regulator LsrR (DeoR family)
MPRGKRIPADTKLAILRLKKLLTNEQIATCLDISERSIRTITSEFQQHGTVEGSQQIAREEVKGKRHLRSIDVEVCNT